MTNSVIHEIECPDCDGNGRVPYSGIHPAMQCTACKGEGWRMMTDEEEADRAADAFSDMCEGEPPVSMDEQHRAAWDQKQELRR